MRDDKFWIGWLNEAAQHHTRGSPCRRCLRCQQRWAFPSSRWSKWLRVTTTQVCSYNICYLARECLRKQYLFQIHVFWFRAPTNIIRDCSWRSSLQIESFWQNVWQNATKYKISNIINFASRFIFNINHFCYLFEFGFLLHFPLGKFSDRLRMRHQSPQILLRQPSNTFNERT